MFGCSGLIESPGLFASRADRGEIGKGIVGIGAGGPIAIGRGPLLDHLVKELVTHDEAGGRSLASASGIGEIGDRQAEILDEGVHAGVVEVLREREQFRTTGLQEVDGAADNIVIVRLIWIDLDHRFPRKCGCKQTKQIPAVIVRE